MASADTPTPEQARAMFASDPGLGAVVTTEGRMRRIGNLEPILDPEPPPNLQSHAPMRVTGLPPRPGETDAIAGSLEFERVKAAAAKEI